MRNLFPNITLPHIVNQKILPIPYTILRRKLVLTFPYTPLNMR